jgi:cytochrome c553
LKSFLGGIACAVAVLAGAIFWYLRAGRLEIAADAPPPAWETALMTRAVHASVARAAPAAQPTAIPPVATLLAGGRIYMNDCVGCHGAPGQPASTFGATFYPRAPQLALEGSSYAPSQLFWVAKHGIRYTGMFPQYAYNDEELHELVGFIAVLRNLPPEVARGLATP